MVCKHIGSTYVSKIYPLRIGEMLQTEDTKSIDLYIEPEYIQRLKELVEEVPEGQILHLILMDVTKDRSSKRIQMMVEECDRYLIL